jgi:hypothetical protein
MSDNPAEVKAPATKSVPVAPKTRVAKAAAETATRAADWPHPAGPVDQAPKKRAAARSKKSATAVPAPAAEAGKAAKVAKSTKARPVVVAPEAKPVKVKLVRDGFTIPSDEYEALTVLKQRALKAAHPVKKSELLRAGLRLLSGLGDAAFLAALAAVPSIKTGRPKGGKKGD